MGWGFLAQVILRAGFPKAYNDAEGPLIWIASFPHTLFIIFNAKGASIIKEYQVSYFK